VNLDLDKEGVIARTNLGNVNAALERYIRFMCVLKDYERKNRSICYRLTYGHQAHRSSNVPTTTSTTPSTTSAGRHNAEVGKIGRSA
ncbi:MAG: hypothetical protein WBV84_10970, partial [Nitrososphaeraceae archaeon]